jgi:hypothetical protein
MRKRRRAGGLVETLRRLFASEALELTASTTSLGADARSRVDRPALPVGRFSLVGLRHVQDDLGDRWPALAERVHALAEAVISRHLLAGDAFECNDEGDYVVLFCRLGEQEAEFKARAISREITERLLGSEWNQLSTVASVSSSIPRTASVADDLETTLTKAFARGTHFVTAREDTSHPGPGEAGAANRAPRSSPAAPEAELSAARGLMLAEGEPPLPKVRPAAVRICRPEPTWRYTPIWDFRHNALIHFRIMPGDARRNEGLGCPVAQEAVFADDVAALRRAVADIVRLAGLDRRLPVTCPLNDATLDHSRPRRELLDELRALPLHVRRLLTLELTPPVGWSRSRPVDQFIQAAQALRVRVCSRLPTHAGSLSMLSEMPGPVCLQLPDGRLPEARFIRFMEAFADRALAAKMDCGVAGVATRSLAIAASAAGYRFLSGRAIHVEISALDNASRFDLWRLYEDLLPQLI